MSESPRILLISGHPQSGSHRFNHALLEAYAQGAQEAGYEIRQIDVAALDFPLLRSQEEWEHGALPPALVPAQQDITWAQHLVFFFPLWLGYILTVNGLTARRGGNSMLDAYDHVIVDTASAWRSTWSPGRSPPGSSTMNATPSCASNSTRAHVAAMPV